MSMLSQEHVNISRPNTWCNLTFNVFHYGVRVECDSYRSPMNNLRSQSSGGLTGVSTHTHTHSAAATGVMRCDFVESQDVCLSEL